MTCVGHVSNMRTKSALPIAIAISMLICTIPLSSAGSAPTNGGTYTVTNDETWNIGTQLDAIVTVSAGATLTISTDYTLPDGASISVSEGGTLRIEDGSLTSEAFSHAVRMTPRDSSLMVHSGIASGSFSLKIVAAEGVNMSGWTVSWDDIQQDLTGSEHIIEFTGPKADFRMDFDLLPGSLTDLVVERLEIHEEGVITSTPAYLSGPINCFMASEFGNPFPLTIDGTAHFEDAAVIGAEVLIRGAATSVDSEFTASGPLNVEGEQASLTLQGGSVTMSSTDHDVNLDGVAQLTWTNTNGTGYLIDKWERNIEQQEIHIPIIGTCSSGYCVEYTIDGIGPAEGSIERKSVDGVALVPARTVEIGYSNGTLWSESASITVDKFRVAWNMNDDFSSWSTGSTVPLPWDTSAFEILPHLEHPIISLDSVSFPSESGKIGRNIDIEITATNSGTGTAAVYFDCNTTDGARADIAFGSLRVELSEGETETITGQWSHGSEEEVGLVCYIQEPLQFSDPSQFITKNSATSSENGEVATVSWSPTEGSDSVTPMLILGALGLTVIIGLGVVIRMASASAEEHDIIHNDSDEERVDLFAEMMEEDDA